MRSVINMSRCFGMGVAFIVWVFLYALYVLHILVVFNIKAIYKQLKLIYICNYHGIYDNCVYFLWWTSLTKTSTAEKVFLTYGEFSVKCYLELRCRIFGSMNAKQHSVDDVVKGAMLNLAEYFIHDGNDDNLKMKYLYAIIDNRIHIVESTKNNITVIKNMIDYYGRDLYKKGIDVII